MQTQAKFHHQFHFTTEYFEVFHTKFNIRVQRLVLLEMILFEKIFIAVVQKFAMRGK